jgi:hypothetical protein
MASRETTMFLYHYLQRYARCRSWVAPLFLALLFGVTVPFASGADVPGSEDQILVFFHLQHPVAADYWSQVTRELKKELPKDFWDRASWVQADSRGSVAYEGRPTVLDVSLTGYCGAVAQDKRVVPGPLGWVLDVNGEIQPFIHISCERIADSVSMRLSSQPRTTERQLLARATGRVMAHEILHVLKQSGTHAHSGVLKSALAPEELTEDTLR